MGRAPCCDKTKVKRGPWSPEEDTILKNYLEKHGTGGNWIALPAKAGLKRCGKSCRLRWLNYLRPDIKHGGFTEEEDNIICTLYKSIGSRWSVIASRLPGRTDNDIKNYWNTKLKKKLLAGKIGVNNNNTNNSTDNLPNNSGLISKVELHDYGCYPSASFNNNSTTLPYLIDTSYLQNYDPQRVILDPINQCPPPPPPPVSMEFSDYSTNNNYSFSSSQEASSLSTSSNSIALENIQEEEILLDFGFDSTYLELLNGFSLQDNI